MEDQSHNVVTMSQMLCNALDPSQIWTLDICNHGGAVKTNRQKLNCLEITVLGILVNVVNISVVHWVLQSSLYVDMCLGMMQDMILQDLRQIRVAIIWPHL